jgi:hypothetical protein
MTDAPSAHDHSRLSRRVLYTTLLVVVAFLVAVSWFLLTPRVVN